MQPEEPPQAGSPSYWLRFAEGDLVLARNKPSEDLLAELLTTSGRKSDQGSIVIFWRKGAADT